MTSVKNTIKELKGTDADWVALIEQETVGENRKSLLEWFERQVPKGVPTTVDKAVEYILENMEEPTEEPPWEEETSIPEVEEPIESSVNTSVPVELVYVPADVVSVEEADETTEESPDDASAPVEPVYVEPELEKAAEAEGDEVLATPSGIALGWSPTVAPTGRVDTIEGGERPINDLIAELSQKRDRWQRSRGCGLENIHAHLSEIQITVQ